MSIFNNTATNTNVISMAAYVVWLEEILPPYLPSIPPLPADQLSSRTKKDSDVYAGSIGIGNRVFCFPHRTEPQG